MVYLGTNKISNRWLGATLLNDRKIFPGLLDKYPATAAYSAGRRLKSSQTYAMTIRRESDNAELDIGFDADGNTDIAAIEEFGGYNLLGYSEEFDNSFWRKLGSSISPNMMANPVNNQINADKIIESTDLSQHFFTVNLGFIFLANNYYTFSIYVKAAGRDRVALSLRSDWFASFTPPFFNLITGQIEEGAGVITSSMESLGNGWYRLSITALCDITGSSPNDVFFHLHDGTDYSYTGDSVSGVYLWGAQLTKGQTLQPYQAREGGEASDCFVPTLYDATGNGNDATQSVATEQPKIYDVATTSIITENGKPALEFNGVNTDLEFPNIAGNSYLDAWFVSRHDGTNSDRFLYPFNPTPLTAWGFVADKDSLGLPTKSYGSPEFYVNGVSSVPAIRDDVYFAIGNFYKLIEHRGASVSTWDEFHIGWYITNDEGYDFEGTFQEIILFTDGSNPTNRTALENNINNYYGIY